MQIGGKQKYKVVEQKKYSDPWSYVVLLSY